MCHMGGAAVQLLLLLEIFDLSHPGGPPGCHCMLFRCGWLCCVLGSRALTPHIATASWHDAAAGDGDADAHTAADTLTPTTTMIFYQTTDKRRQRRLQQKEERRKNIWRRGNSTVVWHHGIRYAFCHQANFNSIWMENRIFMCNVQCVCLCA